MIGVALAGYALWSLGLVAADGDAFDAGKAEFQVRYGAEISAYKVNSIFLMPGSKLDLAIVDAPAGANFVLETENSRIPPTGKRKWQWQAPEQKGLTVLRLHDPESGLAMTFQAFVMVPRASIQNGSLNGYRIGEYPSKPLRGLTIYLPPPGFVEVTRENENTWVSPHFQLKQFVCKQKSDYPRYLVLRERLLLKLEFLLEKVNQQGIACNSFTIMSGFRTPYYNRAIGNVQYSRHVWGGAADIFVDETPRDGIMDDLNGDGVVNREDASWLHRLVESLYKKPDYESFIGGLGLYGANAAHGPFVHVDARGFRARWSN